MPKVKIAEGVFAINKPTAITSYQVVHNLQQAFNASALFASWMQAAKAARDRENGHQRRRRKDKRIQVKVGHGGTLDPLATGVLIAGVGSGTKQLQAFLECTKTYEAVMLFGAATDTYDIEGKVLCQAPYTHVTRTQVDEALAGFRGKIMQRPPIYSALRMQGKRLYEYAREGKEPPAEIAERPVTVESLEIVEWLEGKRHGFRWPEQEAEDEARATAETLFRVEREAFRRENPKLGPKEAASLSSERNIPWKRSIDDDTRDTVIEPDTKRQRFDPDSEPMMSGALQPPMLEDADVQGSPMVPPQAQPGKTGLPASKEYPPAVRLRMTVSSGFYVRSLCHDIGRAVGSLGIMCELIRTRQGDFELGKNVLEYDQLGKGEEIWGPEVEAMLEEWRRRSENMNEEQTADDACRLMH